MEIVDIDPSTRRDFGAECGETFWCETIAGADPALVPGFAGEIVEGGVRESVEAGTDGDGPRGGSAVGMCVGGVEE